MQMKIGRKFNELTLEEYYFFIENHKRYSDFNTLGLYRSILETQKLNLEDKIKVRDYAHRFFKKAFDFLQIKDPNVFIAVSTLGEELTRADQRQHWKTVNQNQQKILRGKKIKHRNFGVYSKHNCGYDTCSLNGVMTKQGFRHDMHFDSDKNRYGAKSNSNRQRKIRKQNNQYINKELEIINTPEGIPDIYSNQKPS